MNVNRTDCQMGDHVHTIGRTDGGHLEPVSQFDYGEIDRRLESAETDDKITFSDASAALALILQWACGQTRNSAKEPVVSAGARINALLFLIDPTNARYKSLTEIAAAAGMTRAAVSKALLTLRDQLGDIMPIRPMMQRENCRKAQVAAIAAGCHSSNRRIRKQIVSKVPVSSAVRSEQARAAALVRWGKPERSPEGKDSGELASAL